MNAPSTANTTAQQRRVINTDGVSFLGWDEADRPVVTALTGIPLQRRTWALTRAGDPADVKGTIRLDYQRRT